MAQKTGRCGGTGLLACAAFIAVASLLLLAACAASPQAGQAKADPTTEALYTSTVAQLTAMNRQAEGFFKEKNSEAAAALVTRGQPLQARLLAAPRPTLAAMEAISDLDDLYARMLLATNREGWRAPSTRRTSCAGSSGSRRPKTPRAA
jgi:hypothetical protein